jgi:hypothetical protein
MMLMGQLLIKMEGQLRFDLQLQFVWMKANLVAYDFTELYKKS